ncbi:MAG: hypothetical protein KAT83_03150 [Candidatus Aenigmarchaeota archaeon]|nr:hypothetical protein [Candidatus Aenigmarchaeota archaeon]
MNLEKKAIIIGCVWGFLLFLTMPPSQFIPGFVKIVALPSRMSEYVFDVTGLSVDISSQDIQTPEGIQNMLNQVTGPVFYLKILLGLLLNLFFGAAILYALSKAYLKYSNKSES